MSPSHDYDLVILGAGPGGYVSAIRASQLGLKAAVIEKDKPGGVCLNIGCIPSKALIHQAEVFRSLGELKEMGISADLSGFSYQKVFAKSRRAAETLSKGVSYLLKKNKVELIGGRGVIVSPQEVEVNGGKISGRFLLVATGSRPKEIPGIPCDEKQVLTSTGALMLESLPKSLCILGGGAIGVEFAHLMNAFGVEVHLVEMMDQILPLEDGEAVQVLAASFRKRGIGIYTGTRATGVEKKGGLLSIGLEGKEGKSSLQVEKLLVVVGRAPNTEGIGLEKVGVKLERGFVAVGDYYQTSVPGIFAVGDVLATPMLAHVASKQGEIAAEHMAGGKPRPRLDLRAIPAAVYCEPQLASFGLTEAEAKREGLQYKSFVFPYRGAGKSVAMSRPEGLVKLLMDAGSHEILGAHVVGAEATELIHELLLAKSAELLPEDLAAMIHAHPTLSEAVMEAARGLEGWAIHV